MAHVRQSRPDYGLVFQGGKSFKHFKVFPLLSEAVWKGVNRCPPEIERLQPPSTPRAALELMPFDAQIACANNL